MSLLAAREIRKRIGHRTILDGVSIAIGAKDRIGLIGANGSGKTSLLKILSGEVEPDAGEVIRRRDLSLAVQAQFPDVDPNATVEAAVMVALQHNQKLVDALATVEAKIAEASPDAMAALLDEQARLTSQLEAAGGWNVRHTAEAAMTALAVPPKDRIVSTLSLGERRRLALCMALIEPRDLLILDEPTNHLDAAGIDFVATTIRDYPGAVLMVSHDRMLLDDTCTQLAEIDRGDLTIYEGNYTAYLAQSAERAALLAKASERRSGAIARELAWARKSAPARTTKQKARLQRLDALVADKPKAVSGEVQFRLPHPPRIGKTILELIGVTKSLGDRKLIDGFDIGLRKGDRLGIVGPNGIGKSTLLKMIIGELEPDDGRIERGARTEIVYADQARSDLNEDETVIEAIAGDDDHVWIGEQRISVHAFAENLLFDGAAQRTKISALSGGERTRVALAKSLRISGNLLILDEPTNDLDLATLRVLESALVAYPGCALIVSHDRWFLNRVATAILAFEGDGALARYEGSYDDYLAASARAAQAPAAAAPAKAKTKAKSAKTKRSYKEEREWEGMEARIMEAEAEVERLEAELNDPEALRSLGAKAHAKVEALEAARGAVDVLYARWEELGAIGS